MCIRLAEKFNEEAEQSVTHQIEARNLVVELWDLAQVVQDDKEHDAFEDHFVKLARVVENRVC